jgi:SagB-type dehydrogenase family enzyme
MNGYANRQIVRLPEPVFDSAVSVEKALADRRSVRNYTALPLTLTELSQILWSAQGLSGPRGLRTAPSAGALYPLEIYIAAGNVTDLSSGNYKYGCEGHILLRTAQEDKRRELFNAALRQGSIKRAPVVLIMCAVYERMTARYGRRGIRYSDMEAGHASQNVYLQAASLGLATLAIGAFDDYRVKKILNLAQDETPLYLMPIGK